MVEGSAKRMAMASDIGRVRGRNEDSVAGDVDAGWAVVADGMGGHRGGDVASAIVVREVTRCLAQTIGKTAGDRDRAAAIADAIGEANRAIIKASNEDLRLHGMGSTVVLASFAGSVLTIGHVGDSRAYLFRRGALERMTVDHSLLQELVDGGMISAAEARRAPGRGVLTRSLGVDPKVEAVVASFPVAPGDLLLLCSDGLTEMVPDAELCEELSRGDDDLGEMTARLIECANRNGGRDNVSVVLVAF